MGLPIPWVKTRKTQQERNNFCSTLSSTNTARRTGLIFESSSRSVILFEHDLFGKTGSHFSGSCSIAAVTGCSVKSDARGMDIGITTVGPIDEARHRVQQGLA